MNKNQTLYTQLKDVTDIYSKIIEATIYQSEENYHFDILLVIYKNKNFITRKKIAKQSRLNQAHLNSVIYYLQAEGFVEMTTNNADITDPVILLTQKGIENITPINAVTDTLDKKITAALGGEGLIVLDKMIEKLKLVLKHQLLSVYQQGGNTKIQNPLQ